LTFSLYINEVPILLKIISKRDILAQEVVTTNDIADITELCFEDYVDIKENYNLITSGIIPRRLRRSTIGMWIQANTYTRAIMSLY